MPDRQPGAVVHAVDFLDPEPIEQTVLQHGARASAALLRRLKDQNCGAGEVARVGEVLCGAEQHGGVTVMAAGVHLARHGRFVGKIGLLLDRQRIHVGAQPDHLAASFAPPDDADDAGSADAGRHFVAAKAFELLRDRRRGAMHVVQKFRMGMEVLPPRGDLGVQVGDAVHDWHGIDPRSAHTRPDPQSSK